MVNVLTQTCSQKLPPSTFVCTSANQFKTPIKYQKHWFFPQLLHGYGCRWVCKQSNSLPLYHHCLQFLLYPTFTMIHLSVCRWRGEAGQATMNGMDTLTLSVILRLVTEFPGDHWALKVWWVIVHCKSVTQSHTYKQVTERLGVNDINTVYWITYQY